MAGKGITIEQAKQLVMADIEAHTEWREQVKCGKMFGVLIVEGPEGRTYLKAYSGQILGRSDWEGYVPAIFDYLKEDGYFKQHESEITDINNKVREEQSKLPPGKRTRELESLKAERKEKSNALQRWLFAQFNIAGRDGQCRSILDVFHDYATANNLKQQYPPGGTGECCAPKLLHYANAHGLRPLELMEFWYGDSPAGEIRHHGQCYEPCQAKCQPILWHMIPKEDFIIHGSMLSLQRPTPKTITEADIIYEDEWLIAVNKPAGLLSVPGKRQLPNAEDMLKEMLGRRAKENGSSGECWVRFVHRLDMDTSGVLLAAKKQDVFVLMQRMFAQHEEVQKEYIALVSPAVHGASEQENAAPSLLKDYGIISLPLSPDFLNRPMQKVDYEEGKEAITRYEVMESAKEEKQSCSSPVGVAPLVEGIGRVRLRLTPLTGRTHQLRVHCAHPDGLGMPIVGDPLYGNVSADRMYLHAETLTFRHPITGQQVSISAPTDF